MVRSDDPARAILRDVFEHGDLEKILDRLTHLEELLVATIADLANDVSALTAAVATLGSGGTTIDAADQATLDSADTAVQQATAAVNTFVTPPAAEPAA